MHEENVCILNVHCLLHSCVLRSCSKLARLHGIVTSPSWVKSRTTHLSFKVGLSLHRVVNKTVRHAPWFSCTFTFHWKHCALALLLRFPKVCVIVIFKSHRLPSRRLVLTSKVAEECLSHLQWLGMWFMKLVYTRVLRSLSSCAKISVVSCLCLNPNSCWHNCSLLVPNLELEHRLTFLLICFSSGKSTSFLFEIAWSFWVDNIEHLY